MVQSNTRFVRLILGVLTVATLCLTIAAFLPTPATAWCTGTRGPSFDCEVYCWDYQLCIATYERFWVRCCPTQYELEYRYAWWPCSGCPTGAGPCPSYCN